MVTFQQSYSVVTNAVMMIKDQCSAIILNAAYPNLL